MNPRPLIFVLTPALFASAIAQEAPPEKALRYHEALLKRPQNAALFDRFYGAWIDEQAVETLDAFLLSQAEKNGGQEWSVLARYQLRRGQEDNALASFAKAMEVVPDDASLPLERAKILLRRMEFAAAREDLAKVAAGKDEVLALEAAKLTGKSWMREGKSAEAVKAWDALLEKHPGDEDLLEDLVESAAAEGEIDQALAYVTKLIEAGADPYKKTLRALRRGDLLAQGGKHDEAVAAYAATLDQVGEGSWLEREVLAQIEKVFRMQDRLDDLSAELIKLAEAHPRRLLIHRQLAKLEAAQGETDSAIGRFREVLKRSPGDRELREEFVRLLTDGERFDDAAAELEKMIELAPTDAGLQLQMAALQHRQNKGDEVLASLAKAHELLGKDEGNGIRIASLMFQYGQHPQGEALLKQLIEAPEAGPAPAEALAAEFGRTNRKDEALELLKKVGAADEVDVVMRAAGSISALGESEMAFGILSAKVEDFSAEPRFLAALAQTALAANKPAEAVPQVMRLVRLSKQSSELGENIGLATRVIIAAEKVLEWRTTLEGQATRTPAETCLLAALAEGQGDFEAVAKWLETATDPLMVHFYAALLDRRGEFELAIAALSRLADTDEGRKAAFFKDLSELQQRAGKTADALATVERWKQSAPGDKSAWVIGSRLLRDSGKPEEAVKVTRQAVARFEGDADLSASLASLHEEAGQWTDAEAIYWRLYDESQTPSDQVRWAAQLAQLAMRTGRTEELDEKLQERARGNRRSIGPVLAQVELARVLQNDEKRRDLLLEAMRLQPKDVDLRLQIANLEEQSGNPERVVAILEEALNDDSSGRIRSALAQAYLRQGQTLKGMRELQAMSGKNANDPRSLESSAATLAGAGMYEEAIRFLRESLPDGGDWRTQYLLAVMLEHDGREAEALPIFLSLQQAQGDLTGIMPNPQGQRNHLQHYPEEIRSMMTLTMSVQSAYAHQNQQQSHRYGGMSMTGPFVLPDDAESARRLSLVHLGRLSKKSGELNEGIAAQLRAAGVTNIQFVSDFTESGGNGQPDFAALLEKHPEEPGLFEMVLLYSSYYGQGTKVEPALVGKAMENVERMTPLTRFRAGLILTADAKEDDPAWDALVAAARDCLNDKDQDKAMQVGYQLLQVLSAETATIPETRREELKKVLLDFATTATDEEGKLAFFTLSALATAGTREQWIDALNVQLKKFRENAGKSGTAGFSQQMQARISHSMQMRGYNPWMSGQSPFTLPELESLSFTSVPANFLSMIRPKEGSSQRYYGYTGIDPAELIKLLDRFESPVLRAWVALRAGDAEAANKALAATPPAIEAADFNLLLAWQAIQGKKFADAYRLLEKTRAASSGDRHMVTWLNLTLIAVASEMTEEERKAIAEPLRAVIVQSRQALGTQGAPVLAEKAKQLGFEELANRFQPPAIVRSGGISPLGPAAIGARVNRSSSSSGGNASIERLTKLTSEKKHEAAAREALLLFRKAKSNQWNSGYEIRQLSENLSEEVRAELIRMAEPGDSKSLTKRLEYADICAELGKPEEALAILEILATERPDDASIAGKMAFLLPPDQRERTLALMNRAASSEDFVDYANNQAQQFSNRTDNKKVLEFFDTIATWLESADPEGLEKANLSWVGYHSKRFFEGGYSSDLPTLLSEQPKEVEDKPTSDKRIALSKRMALAMLRHPGISEEGFRLLSGSKAWELPPEELDAMARAALLVAKLDRSNRSSSRSFFTLTRRNGGSSSGGNLDEHSSVRWLTTRLGTEKSADKILPPGYLEELTAKDSKVGELVTALAGISTVEQLGKLWESDSLKSASDPVTLMLRQGVLARAGTVKGAGKFFLSRIGEIPPAKFNEGMYRGNQGAEFSLLGAALLAGSAGSQADLDAICAAVSKLVFGEGIDWENTGDGQEVYRKLSSMESLLRPLTLDAAATIRLHRSFFRLGTPVGSNEYSLMQPFQNRRLSKVEDGEAMLESLGWLVDVANWEPFAAVIVDTNHSGGKIGFTRQAKLLNERVMSYTSTEFSRSDLVKRLKERKPQTFGTLITAASLTSGKERSELTAAAFAAAKPSLAKLTPARMEAFALLLPWLPPEDVAKLPASFREKAKKLDDSRRLELAKRADDFLANKTPQRSHNSPLNEMQEVVTQLAPLDLAKAVELFLEAERRFTASLTRGGRLSSWTSNGLSIAERDAALNSILSDSDSPLSKDIPLAFRFLSAVLNSPEGARFSLASTSYEGQPILYRLGTSLRGLAGPSENNKDPDWLRAMKAAGELPEELRQDALFASFCYDLTRESSSADMLARERKNLDELRGVPETMMSLRRLMVGVIGWDHDTPEQRSNTSKALVLLLGDESIPESTRIQLGVSLAAKSAGLLADPALSSAIATHFEGYCETERSVVNTLGLGLMKAVANAPASAECQPFTRRIHDAFWKNANAPKAGGHSQIPPDSVTSLFVAAARVDDEATAAKLLAQARTNISGDLPTVASLIRAGQFELAKSMLPEPGRIYRTAAANETFNRELEQKLAEFAKQGVDPLEFARLECQLLSSKAAEGELAPEKPTLERALRLAAAFKEDPPKDRMIQLEMLSALTRSSFLVSPELRDELKSFASTINFETALRDWTNGTGAPTDLNPRYLTGMHECTIIRQLALASLLDGDVGPLDDMVKVLVDAPKFISRRSNSNGSAYALRFLHRDLINAAHTWTCFAVASGQTTGIEKALEPLESLTASIDARQEMENNQVISSLALCQFLAHWNGQPERFDALVKRMEKKKDAVKFFSGRWGLRYFAEAAARHPAWSGDHFAATRKEFLIQAFSRPSLAGLFPYQGGWVGRMGQTGLKDELLLFSSPIPDDFLPAVRAPLMFYRGKQVAEEAIPSFRQAVAEVPPGPKWNHFRGSCKYELAAALHRDKQSEEAKTIHASIPPEEIGDWLKERHQKLGANLAARKKK